MMAEKWLDSIEKQKRRSNLKERVSVTDKRTDIGTDRHSQQQKITDS